MQIKLYDRCFYGDAGASKYSPPTKLTWVRNPTFESKWTVFTDQCLGLHTLESTKKAAWLIEPFSISPQTYRWVSSNWQHFDIVLSHHKDFVKTIPNAQWYPNQMTWVSPPDHKIYEKTKNFCFITSNKQMTPLQQWRVKLANALRPWVDVYGMGFNAIEHKIDVLKDYRFCVVVENSIANGYYSEKLIDCLLTGTVPLYIGSPDLSDLVADMAGVLTCKPDETAMINAIRLINSDEGPVEFYNQLKTAIQANFDGVKFTCPEDYIAQFLV